MTVRRIAFYALWGAVVGASACLTLAVGVWEAARILAEGAA